MDREKERLGMAPLGSGRKSVQLSQPTAMDGQMHTALVALQTYRTPKSLLGFIRSIKYPQGSLNPYVGSILVKILLGKT